MYRWIERFSFFLAALIVFAIPIEHKYDKPLRNLSKSLASAQISLPVGFDQKIYFYPSDFCALFLFISALFIFRIPLRKLLLDHGAPFLWILFFLAIGSILNSPFASYPVVYTRLLQLLTPILLFTFLTHCTSPKKATTILFSALLFAALFQSAIGITQYFLQEPLGLRILGEQQFKPQDGSFSNPSNQLWIFDAFIPNRPSFPWIHRITGTFSHCNVLGGFLTLSILGSYFLIQSASKRSVRYLLGMTLPIQLFALNLTYSRSALFGWILGTLVWFTYSAYHEGIQSFCKNRTIRFLGSILLLSTVLNIATLSEQSFARGGIANYNEVAQNSDMIRLDAIEVSKKIIQSHPLLGGGYQQYSDAASRYIPKGRFVHGVHNIYLFLAAETGLIALSSFIGFILFILLKAYQACYRPELGSLLGMFITLLFIGGCDFYPILFQQGKLMFFSIAGLLMLESTHQLQWEPNANV